MMPLRTCFLIATTIYPNHSSGDRSGLHRSETSLLLSKRVSPTATIPSTDTYIRGGLPTVCSLSRSLLLHAIFVFPSPYEVRLDGGQEAMPHLRQCFGLPLLPFSSVLFTAATSEAQRASRGQHVPCPAHNERIGPTVKTTAAHP